MPFNTKSMTRRRTLLGITQYDLAVIAGIAPSTIQKLEQGKTPNDGSNMGIDICMRIAAALQMSPLELMIAPTGNRYARSVQFAKNQHDPAAAPKLHDRGSSIRARSYRALTSDGLHRDMDTMRKPEEDDAIAMDDVGDPVRSDENVGVSFPSFMRDPSTE